MQPLVTLAELTTHLGTEPDDPVAAEQCLAGASGIVRAYCGWAISADETTFTVDGSGTTILNLPTLRLIGVDEVRVAGIAIPAHTPNSYTGGYEWSTSGQLYWAAGWPAWFRVVEVDCAHGYNETPDEVRAVVLDLAGRALRHPDSSQRSRTVGGVTTTFFATAHPLDDVQLARLAGHRLP